MFFVWCWTQYCQPEKIHCFTIIIFLGGYNQGYGAMPSAPAGQYDPRKVPGGQGYPPAGAYQQLPSYQQQQAVIVQPQPQIIVVGGCPACRVKQFY